ncbi:hypothetical protein IJ765_02125 [Candidatus Saccharibacteria bacterium]|nr:hypothetical protein [Candidatus Saccharibacteria bacterium]
MAFSITSTSAFAEEIDETTTAQSIERLDDIEVNLSDPILPESTSYNRNFYTDTWTNLYSGTGAAVVLDVTNYSAFWCSIEMFNYSGTSVWYQEYSVPPNDIAHYYVGRNVATVKIRGCNGMGTVHVTVYPAE